MNVITSHRSDRYSTNRRLQEYCFLESSATSQSQMKLKLDSNSDVSFEHLLKIYYFRDFPYYRADWTTSVFHAHCSIPKLKSTHKYPTASYIFEYVWNNKLDIYNVRLSNVIDYLNTLEDLPTITNQDSNNVKSYCEEYYEWLSVMLSRQGEVSSAEVSIALDMLLDKYPYSIGGEVVEDKV